MRGSAIPGSGPSPVQVPAVFSTTSASDRSTAVRVSANALLRHEHGRALDAPLAQVGQRRVCRRKIVPPHVRLNRHRRRKRQELAGILPGQVCNRPHDALSPQQPVRKRRYITHVDAGADHATASFHAGQRFRNEPSDRREEDRSIERLRRRIGRSPCPYAAQPSREELRRFVARGSEGVDLASFMNRMA